MRAFLQMGHDSSNLLSEKAVSNYSGVIISPINESPDNVKPKICDVVPKTWARVLDPQMYFPDTPKMKLADWPYFPDLFATSDMMDIGVWKSASKSMVGSAVRCGCNAICSPALFPRVGSDDYYGFFAQVARHAGKVAEDKGLNCYHTIVVRANEMFELDAARRVASIVTSSGAERFYLVFHHDMPPRQEATDVDAILARMELVRALRGSGAEVLIGYTGADSLLHAHAGADASATGKFFNLRRYTTGRFGVESTFGTQKAYWFEEAFLSPLVSADFQKVGQLGLWSQSTKQSPFLPQVLDKVNHRKPWVALGWRQYLSWFGDMATALADQTQTPTDLVSRAVQSFKSLREKGYSLEETGINDQFVRSWKRAINEFDEN